MNRPHKRPDSSFHYFRKSVPADLQDLVGKKTVKVSLRTRDPAEAKVRHAQVAAEVEARWAQLKRGVITVSQKQATAIAGEIYRELVTANEENPGEPRRWSGPLLADWMFLRPEKVRVIHNSKSPETTKAALEKMRMNRNASIVKNWLDRHGYRVDDESLLRIKQAANLAIMQGREHLLRNAEGDYRPDPDANRFPEFEPQNSVTVTKNAASDTSSPIEVFERYAKEARIKPSTVKRWRPIVTKVQNEHSRLSDITPEWAVVWKNRLVESGLDNNTIRDAYLAAMRTVCKWAVANKELPSNPFAGITIKGTKRGRRRQKGFLDAEAQTILNATFDPVPKRFSPEHAAARRWVPWLCAYLGARVGEIGQLRGQDIRQEDGIWLVWITPDAGSTKNESARHIALHPHLIEQGFIEFVRRRGKGPLFYNPARRRGGSAMNPQAKKIGERIAGWVRQLGVDDPDILPNHAWRHRFKTLARKVRMDVGARDYMQGHVPATEGEAYGDFPPDVLFHEISKLPKIEVRSGLGQVQLADRRSMDDEVRPPA